MIWWAVYVVAAFGLAYIVGHARITFPFRLVLGGDETTKPAVPVLGPFFIEMLECPACFGFWEGLLAGALWVPGPKTLSAFAWCVALGCATSGTNFILGRITRLI